MVLPLTLVTMIYPFKAHTLYVPDDFKHMSGEEMEDNMTARLVLDGGLGICKVCGEYEAGLDKPCK